MKVEKLIETMEAVISSNKIGEYKPGISCNSRNRRNAYFGEGFDYYLVLESQLTASQALRLEERVHEIVHSNCDSVLYSKFDQKTRDSEKTPRSLGGKLEENKEKYDFYIACFKVEEEA